MFHAALAVLLTLQTLSPVSKIPGNLVIDPRADAGVDRGRIIGYLQGQSMRSDARRANEWTTLSGVFPLPEGATAIALSLRLAERRGDPQNGSAARFDDVTLVLQPSERDARAFLAKYAAAHSPRGD